LKRKIALGIMLMLFLMGTFSMNFKETQSDFVEGWIPYIQSSLMVDLKFWMSAGTSYVNVTITFPDSGYMVSDWGTVARDGGEIWVDSEIWDWTGYSFQIITTLSHTYNLGQLDGYYTFTFKAWGNDVKSVSFTATTAQMLLETDKDVYILGENVTITLENIGTETVSIGGYPAWGIYTYPEESLVYPKIYAWLLWSLEPGENDTIIWNQYNAFTNSPVYPGMYVVRDTKGWSLSAYFTILAGNLPPTAIFTYSPTVPIVSETVTFDASSSYDPDGTIIGYSWAFGDGMIANDTGPITTYAYADAGNYSVTLYVYDDDYQPDSYTLNVTVTHGQIPVEATQELIETIETWNLPKGLEKCLTSKLDNAIHQLNKGNENVAINKLIVLINQIEALRDKKLTSDQANYLIAEIQGIKDLIHG